jgi:hypothetical protein
MRVSALTHPGSIIAILLLQFIPLVLLPAESYSLKTQEWWLSILLALMVLVADAELILRRGTSTWPWYLISFAQGFNIISRLMLVWPHSAIQVEKTWIPNWDYLLFTFAAVALSTFLLWYTELPQVRTGLLRRA